MSWSLKPADEPKVDFLMEKFDLSRVMATILSRLNIDESRAIKRFLQPKLTHLQSPFSIPNLEKATERLIQAIANKDRVFVLGDYDVDGVTSTSLFVRVIRECGLDPVFSVPKRTDEGYGLNLGLVKEKILCSEQNFELVVALDCGSNDAEAIETLYSQGIDVLVVDHHQVREDVHPNVVLVNPHAPDGQCEEAKILCSVALTFKLMQGLLIKLREKGVPKASEIFLKDYLDFVALGTLTDLVPLVGENRIMVAHGLSRIGKSKHFGLQALMDVCSLPYGKDIDVADVSFKLGPRINAGGRMADATLSVNLLLSKNFHSCIKYADELDILNQNRQSTERLIYDQAISYLSRRPLKHAVVLYDPEWHTGVVGIVSSRIARHCQLPVIVLGAEGEFAKGSARSVEGINIIEALESSCDYLESWGGHPMAAGLSIRPEDIERFREAFTRAVKEQCSASSGQAECSDHLEVDAWIDPEDITYEFMNELKKLGPFGVSNSEPIIGIKGAQLASKVSRFGSDNFKFWVHLIGSDFDLMCLGWGFPSRIPENRHPLDLVFNLKWHEWKGRGYPQATIVDWRYSVSESD